METIIPGINKDLKRDAEEKVDAGEYTTRGEEDESTLYFI